LRMVGLSSTTRTLSPGIDLQPGSTWGPGSGVSYHDDFTAKGK
jgi:hypothetical protein